MRLGNITDIASSGMRLATQRLAQSAANTANVETPGYAARDVVSLSRAGGGVSGSSVPTYAPHSLRVEDNGSLTVGSNTDIVEETVTQLSSLREFQANAAVLRTADSMLGELIDTKA